MSDTAVENQSNVTDKTNENDQTSSVNGEKTVTNELNGSTTNGFNIK